MKLKNAYFLSHNGLGDNITNIGAINFLLQYYENIYFLCKDIYNENVKLLFYNRSVITIPFNSNNELNECKQIIKNISQENDIFISGRVHKNYTKSRITHPELIKYIQGDKGYDIKYQHIRNFYYDIGLDLSIYYNYFNIESSDLSIYYYSQIKKYKIIFTHTKASNREINIDDIINKYKQDEEYIIICANKNVYEKTNEKYHLCEKYVNIYVAHYIDIIKNAHIIHVIDSCFSCIVLPLLKTNQINTTDCNIIDR